MHIFAAPLSPELHLPHPSPVLTNRHKHSGKFWWDLSLLWPLGIIPHSVQPPHLALLLSIYLDFCGGGDLFSIVMRVESYHGAFFTWRTVLLFLWPLSHDGVPRRQKLRSLLLRILNYQRFLFLKPGIGQKIALHASPAASNSAFQISVVLVSESSFNIK